MLFEDGSEYHDFDMVVGADGIRSTTAQFLSAGDATPSAASSRGSYSGIRITYCVTAPDSSLRSSDRGVMNQWLGDGCYALTATYGGLRGLQHMLAVVYNEKEDSRFGSNADWTADQKQSAADSLRARLKDAGLGHVEELEAILAASFRDGRFFESGIKDALLPLGKWSSKSGRVVLIGDSAHAM